MAWERSGSKFTIEIDEYLTESGVDAAALRLLKGEEKAAANSPLKSMNTLLRAELP